MSDVTINQQALEDFKARLHGQLIFPSDADASCWDAAGGNGRPPHAAGAGGAALLP